MKKPYAVILDHATMDNDISLSELENICRLKVYPATLPDEISERICGAEIVISNKVKLGEKEFTENKSIKLVCVAATGYNNIDIDAAKRHGIIVCNVKNYSTESVVQTVFALILELTNSTSRFNSDVRTGEWMKSPVFTMLTHPFYELNGKNLGIIGYGTIGKRVAEVGKAFGMNVLIACSFNPKNQESNRLPMDAILKQSDILTIHTPLTDTTRNLIGENELRKMKSNALIINAARGGIVNEQALYDALTNGTIAGAGFDVLTEEPPRNGNILLTAPNIIITPHIAWTSKESRKRLLDAISTIVKRYADDDDLHDVDLTKCR